MTSSSSTTTVNFALPRSFGSVLVSDLRETLFPDDPFHVFKNETTGRRKAKKALQYFVPIFEWLPKYSLKLFKYDLLAGITIASLAIPQGISYARLANVPPIVGLYSSFVPPFIYAVLGSSKYLAVGTVAASSVLIAATISERVHPADDPTLYLNLVFTSTLISGLFEALLGFLRLGILVEFLSHSTITGFMGGTAVIIILQQLKGFLGMKHFTTHTDVVSVMRAIFSNKSEWRWESAVLGIIFLAFLQLTKFVKKKRPKLFWMSAIAPIITVIVGGLFAKICHSEKHGIPVVGPLKRGINPSSVNRITFDAKYVSAPIKAGIITAAVSLAEGIAIGRSFAILTNEQIDGNKEMVAFGLMNIIGSLTSCYLTTGPFSKSAVNFNAGAKSAMSNIVMGICLLFTLLFLAPLFRYTPLVALSAIIMSAMLGLIEYDKAYHFFKNDKFDFLVCMVGFLGAAFVSMNFGLMLSVGLSLLRALHYVARPASSKLGNIPNSTLYRDVEQYPGATSLPGLLLLQLGSPLYFANAGYLRDRIQRWIINEQEVAECKENFLEYILLDLGGVSSIDITGAETLFEIQRNCESKGIKMVLINPRIEVMEKLILTKFIDHIGKEWVFLSIEDAVRACQYSLRCSKQLDEDDGGQSSDSSYRV